MAIYTGRYTLSAKNKVGGLVLSGTTAVNTMRSRIAPISASTPGHNAARMHFANTMHLWRGLSGAYTYGWIQLATWLRYGTGEYTGSYTPAYPYWLSAQNNARLLGTTQLECTTVNPAAPTPITGLNLTNDGYGNITATPTAGGDPYTLAWMLYCNNLSARAGHRGSTAGGTFIAGNLTGAGINITSELLALTGAPTTFGASFAMRCKTLYAGSLVSAQSYSFVSTVEG